MNADAKGAPVAGEIVPRFQGLLGMGKTTLREARLALASKSQSLVAAEPVLRRAIPILIISFLMILGMARGLSLLEQRRALEEDALQDLKIGATLVRAELSAVDDAGMDAAAKAAALLTSILPNELITNGRFALITDADGIVIATTPGHEQYLQNSVGTLLSGIQPLMIFGKRAGVMKTQFAGKAAFVSTARLGDTLGSLTFVQPKTELYAGWRRSASISATMFAITSLIMLVILYAYFCQLMRAKVADVELSTTHQRVETALSRGRCGLWDWDLARGRMFWSRSMYEILGMQVRTASFRSATSPISCIPTTETCSSLPRSSPPERSAPSTEPSACVAATGSISGCARAPT